MSEAAELASGTIIGHDFRIERRIGVGGMGAVYEVEQLSTGRRRALKVMLATLVGERHRERFASEARVVARIQSQHVVDVIGAGFDEQRGLPWIAMELVRGESLDQRIERTGAIPLDEAMHLLEQLAHGLGEAHALGIVHRDLKPENLLLAEGRTPGAGSELKILDFGIASVIDASRRRAVVTTAIGTPFWMAPEQAKPGEELTPATDVWSLGLIAYYLITGRQYWRAANVPRASIESVLTELLVNPLAPASLRAHEQNVSLPPGFDLWFSQTVNRDAKARHPDARAAVGALRAILSTIAIPRTLPMVPVVPQTRPHDVQSSVPPWTPVPPWRPESATPWPVVHEPAVDPRAAIRPGTIEWRPEPSPPATTGDLRPPRRIAPWIFAAGGVAVLLALVAVAIGLAIVPPEPDRVPAAIRTACASNDGCQALAGECFGTTPGRCGELAMLFETGAVVPSDPARARELYERGCGDGESAACTGAGDLVKGGEIGDAAAAREYYTRGCNAGDARGCSEAGLLFDRALGGERDLTRAQVLYAQGCEGGDSLGCSQLGYLFDFRRANDRDYPRARDLFRRKCDEGVGGACMGLAVLHEDGLAVERDYDRALDLYQRACDRGSQAGCTGVGYLHEAGLVAGASPARAVELYRAACDAGETVGCWSLGHLYLRAVGVERDFGKSRELYQHACDAGDSVGCSGVAGLYEQGIGVERDLARAKSLYERGCDGQDTTGCDSLGLLYIDGRGVDRDHARGRELLMRSCEHAHASACRELGALYLTGSGVTADPARARELFERACDGSETAACGYLGYIYDDGRGVTADPARARELYQLGCDGVDRWSCTQLGVMYRDARTVERSYPEAIRYFTRACDGADVEGCSALAYMHRNGLGVERDPDRAVVLFERVCERGYTRACVHLASMLAAGTEVTQDLRRARELYRESCDGGDATACNNLAVMYADGRGVAVDRAEAAALYQRACDGGLQVSCGYLRRLRAAR